MTDQDRQKAGHTSAPSQERGEKGSAMTLIRETFDAQKAKTARLKAERIARDTEMAETAPAPKKAAKSGKKAAR